MRKEATERVEDEMGGGRVDGICSDKSSETSVLTTATRSYVTEDGILQSHRRENLKSYIALTD
jgi:hypothetical protein